MRAKEEKPNAMNTKPVLVTVKRSFTASAEQVFDAWLDPDSIGRWMFGKPLRDEEVLRLAIEPRVGGAFSFLVRRGGKEINHIGKYLEIDRPSRLVFTWAVAPDSPEPGVASRVVVEIAPRGKRCDLTLVHELQPQWADYAARVEETWTKEFNVLAATFSSDA